MEPRLKTTASVRGTTRESEAAARGMRRDMTPAESILWEALRDRRLRGLKFRRQHPLGPFILDFCCVSCRLAVEVDGGIHAQQQEYDQFRTESLGAYGYRVIRFRNEEVLHELASVLRRIAHAAAEE